MDDNVAVVSIGDRFACVIGKTLQRCEFLDDDEKDCQRCAIGLDLDDGRSLKTLRSYVDGTWFNRMEVRNQLISSKEIVNY